VVVVPNYDAARRMETTGQSIINTLPTRLENDVFSPTYLSTWHANGIVYQVHPVLLLLVYLVLK
jgi:hypothetical protein